MTNMTDISKKLIKIRVSISCWNGNVRSEQGASELCASHGAESEDVNAGVTLLPKAVQKELRDHVTGIRKCVKRVSIPWKDTGDRIIKAADYADLNKEVKTRVANYRNFVMDEVVSKYDELYGMAERRLNGLFDGSKFPSAEQIANKYGATLLIEPITNPNDIRLDGISEDDLEQIKTETVKEYQTSLKEGQQEILENFANAVQNIMSKTDREKSRYGKAVNSLVDLCDSITKLNVLDDPRLTKIAEDIKSKLGNITTDEMKEPANQNKVKTVGKDLLDVIGNIQF